MAKHSSKLVKRLWWALAASVGVWLLLDIPLRPFMGAMFSSVEGGLTDLRHKSWWFLRGPTPDDPGSPVTVIDIDERTLGRLGTYGESYRRYHALVVDRLTRAGAGALSFDVFFKATDSGVFQERLVEQAFRATGIEYPRDSASRLHLRQKLDHSRELGRAIAQSPRCVVVGQLEDHLKYPNPSDWIPRATRAWQHSISEGVALPAAQLATLPGLNVLEGIYPGLTAPGVAFGLVNTTPDIDGRNRRLHPLWRFPDTQFVEPRLAPEGSAIPRAYPAASLRAALLLLGRGPADFKLSPGLLDLGVPLRIWKDPSGSVRTSAPELTAAMVEDLQANAGAIDSLRKGEVGSISPTRTVWVERGTDGRFVTRLAYPDTLDDAVTRALLANAGDTSWLSQLPLGQPAALSEQVLVSRDSSGALTLASYDRPGGTELSRTVLPRRERDILLLHLGEFLPAGLESLAPGGRVRLSSWIEVWWDRVRRKLASSLLPLRGSSLVELIHLPPARIQALAKGDTLGIGRPIHIPLDSKGAMLLHFQAPEAADQQKVSQGWIRHVSFVDVLDGKFDESLIPGRAFVIGSSATGLFDFVSIPLQERYPGVNLQAVALQNIVSSDFLREPPRWIRSAFVLGMALGAGLLVALVSPLWAIAGTGLLLVAGFSASLWAFDRGVWTDMQLPFLAAVGTMIAMLAVRWLLEAKEKKLLNAAFKTYLSAEVIDEMAERGELPTLGGKEYAITPLFTDIQGFSSFSELLTPEQLVTLLNEYLGAMTDILLDERGTFDKYIGDAIVAFWGAPSVRPDHAASAVRTALKMQRKLSLLRAKWVAEGDRWPAMVHGMRMRIGLNSGVAVIGNMGTQNRMQYTMMGDCVNLAARLESGSKQYGVYVLVSRETVDQAGPGFLCRELDLVKVMGKSEPVAVYEVLCERERVTPERLELVERWGRARALYLAGDFAAAREAFAAARELEPWIGEKGVKACPSEVFASRCGHFLEHPPLGWDGVWTATEK